MPLGFNITLTNCLRCSLHLNKQIFSTKVLHLVLWLVVGLGFPEIFYSRFPGNGRARFAEKTGMRKTVMWQYLQAVITVVRRTTFHRGLTHAAVWRWVGWGSWLCAALLLHSIPELDQQCWPVVIHQSLCSLSLNCLSQPACPAQQPVQNQSQSDSLVLLCLSPHVRQQALFIENSVYFYYIHCEFAI